jgi:hypothetical protein
MNHPWTPPNGSPQPTPPPRKTLRQELGIDHFPQKAALLYLCCIGLEVGFFIGAAIAAIGGKLPHWIPCILWILSAHIRYLLAEFYKRWKV